MGIAAVIGIVSSVIQAVRAFSSPETPPPQPQAADRLFSRLDELGRGEIGSAELQSAFDRMRTGTAENAEQLFARLDADGDGRITKGEFSASINRLAEQLDDHFARLRLHGERALPPLADAGYTRDELTGLVSGIAGNFDRADADGDGRVSIREMRAYAMNHSVAPPAPGENRNVEMMLQVVRLMQAYGVVGGAASTADGSAQRVSDQV